MLLFYTCYLVSTCFFTLHILHAGFLSFSSQSSSLSSQLGLLKVPSSCTTGLFFSWALSKFSLESGFTREDQGACYLGTCPSHLCSQSPPVTFNLLKAFSWLLHWCLSRWAAREAVRKADKLWQPLCNTIDPGSRQAADLPRWPIWLPNRMLHPTEGKDTNHYCLSWHLHRIGLNSVTWGVQLTVPPAGEIIHTSLLMTPRQTATNRDSLLCVHLPTPTQSNTEKLVGDNYQG